HPPALLSFPARRSSDLPLSPVIASDWERSVRVFADKPGFQEVFMPGGRAPREGEIFRNPALAKTLRLLAEKGRDAYYKGSIAQTDRKSTRLNSSHEWIS